MKCVRIMRQLPPLQYQLTHTLSPLERPGIHCSLFYSLYIPPLPSEDIYFYNLQLYSLEIQDSTIRSNTPSLLPPGFFLKQSSDPSGDQATTVLALLSIS